MPSDVPSKADRALVQHLREAGVEDMSDWRLLRWRRAGLIPSPSQAHVPGQRGSTSEYPEGAFEQALFLVEILKRHRSLDKAALLLFLHGYEIGPNPVRKAILSGLDYVDRMIARKFPELTEPREIAEVAALMSVTESLRTPEESARRSAQAQKAGGSIELADVRSVIFRVYLGERLDVNTVLSAFAKLGFSIGDFFPARIFGPMSGLAWRMFLAPLAPAFARVADAGGIPSLVREQLAQCTRDQLVSLREDIRPACILIDLVGLPIPYIPPDKYFADIFGAFLRPRIAGETGGDGAGAPSTISLGSA